MDNRTRLLVRERATHACEYCLLREEDDAYTFHVEHIIPQKHQGTDEDSNLALACQHCNLHKGSNLAGYDPDSSGLTPLYHPRQQQWSEHFRFVGAQIEGITAVGRTTIQVLNMNQSDRMQIRELLGYSNMNG